MEYYEIQNHILEVFTECNVDSFPIDCRKLLEHYGYSIYTYQELSRRSRRLYDICCSFSKDAFRAGSERIVAYNNAMPKARVRFSLAHELGHHVLKHQGSSRRNEIEANYFAGHLLAPRVIIYYSGCQNSSDIAHTFLISKEAASIAWEDYCRWYRYFCACNKHLTNLEYRMYAHFCQKSDDPFIQSAKT